MCTISLFPDFHGKNSFVLTSNRDEAVGRKTLAPEFKDVKGVKLLFPEDEVAGGTWIGVSEYKRAICLMNGGFEKHERNPPYRKSRGLIVKELLTAQNLLEEVDDQKLLGVEPFTTILVDWRQELKFYELVWDGSEKHFRKLSLSEHIWSSSPLYDKNAKKMREEWFVKMENDKGLSAESLLEFHQHAGEENKENGLIIDRGFLKTQSITQIIYNGETLNFWYKDLDTGKITSKEWDFREIN